jgi:hypothetical protein
VGLARYALCGLDLASAAPAGSLAQNSFNFLLAAYHDGDGLHRMGGCDGRS